MGLGHEMMRQDRGATSTRPDGASTAWKLIWQCPVPAKMRLLAWKICKNAISTQSNLYRRHMATMEICQICGRENEDSIHIFLRCPHAHSLWQAMKEVWDLPDLQKLKPVRQDWLLRLLQVISVNQRAMTLMVLWRIWHAHNELTHDKECPSIEGSRRFLVSYLNSLLLIKQWPNADLIKGKMVIDNLRGFKQMNNSEEKNTSTNKKWRPLLDHTTKLNVDGSFVRRGVAGTGMILRNSHGEVIIAACRHQEQCQDALESELMAIEDGVKLCLVWSQSVFSVESDCAEAIELIKATGPNVSAHAFRINSIRELLRERNSSIVKIGREENRASHELAQLGRVQSRTEVWLGSFPSELSATLAEDCNFVYH
jgi:hypothetical protein